MSKRLPCKAFLADAIRRGIKTETRRLLSQQPPSGFVHQRRAESELRPRYEPGDLVEIVEPWQSVESLDAMSGNEMVAGGYGASVIRYAADGDAPDRVGPWGRARLARFMPSAFVRTRVEIVSVEVQRLNEITVAQAITEGIEKTKDGWRYYLGDNLQVKYARDSFASLWDSLHAAPSPVRDGEKRIVAYQSFPWAVVNETREFRGKPWSVFGNAFVWRYQFRNSNARE